MRTLLDLRGAIPAFIHVSDGKMSDVNVLDILTIEAGAFFVTRCPARYGCATCVFGQDRQGDWCDLRSEDRYERFLCVEELSRTLVTYPFQRPRVGQNAGVSDQQHNPVAVDHRRLVQESLAGGIVLQMDQATPAHQAFSGHKRERGEDANLVRRVHLCADRDT